MDGRWAVSRSHDYELILWNVHQRTPVDHCWEWSDNYASAVISPDSQFIAGLIEDDCLLLYNLQSPALPPIELVLPRNSSVEYYTSSDQTVPCSCLWSTDGTQLVVYITTPSLNQVFVFTVPSWTLHCCISTEQPRVKQMLTPELSLYNGNQSLVAWNPAEKESYQLWDFTRGTLHYQPFPPHWHEDSKGFTKFYRHYTIYFTQSESTDAFTMEVFDMLTTRSLAILSSIHHDMPRDGIWISPDESHITVLFSDATVTTWDLATETEIHSFRDPYAMAALATCDGCLSPDGLHVLLSYDGAVMRLLRVADGACLATFAQTSLAKNLQFSPDGMTLCYTTWDDGRVFFEPIGHLLSSRPPM